MLHTTSLIPIRKGGCLTHPNFKASLYMSENSLLIPISKGGVLHTQFLCITPVFVNDLKYIDNQGEILAHQNSSEWFQMLKTTFIIYIRKDGVLPIQATMHDSNCCKPLLLYTLSRGILTHPNSRVLFQMLQMTFLIPIRNGESYPPKP